MRQAIGAGYVPVSIDASWACRGRLGVSGPAFGQPMHIYPIESANRRF